MQLVVAFLPFLAAADAAAEAPAGPARHALVLATSEYEHLLPIPSSAEDGRRVVPALKELGFDVTEAAFTSRRQLEDVLVDFRRAVEVGDLVLVYFSGHGFAHGPFNYMASTRLATPIEQNRLLESAISLEELADFFSCAPRKLGCRSPGAVVFVHDACRSFTLIEVVEDDGDTLIAKGAMTEPDLFRRADNFLIAYSSELGTLSLGNGLDGEASVFTKHLVRELGAEGVDLEDLLEETAAKVEVETDWQQRPGKSDWNRARIFFRPTAEILDKERELWEVARSTGRREEVQLFLIRHTTSRHAAAARQWLLDHPQDVSAGGYTLVSPEAVERAWTSSDQRLAVRRIQLPLALHRSFAEEATEAVARLSDAEVGLVPSGTTAARLRAASIDADKLPFDARMAHAAGSAVLLSAAHAFVTRSALEGTEPGARQPVILVPGTPLRILSIEPLKASDRFVVAAELPAVETPVYLSLPRRAPQPPVELGQSLREVLLPASAMLPDLAETAALDEALDELRAAGRTITWASLAAGETAIGEESEDLATRLEHVRYVLERRAVDGTRQTAVLGRTEVPAGIIRVRIFGY